MHTATINSNHISISADERIKADWISNVIIIMIPDIVLWMVLVHIVMLGPKF